MANGQNEADKKLPGKKELKKQLADKMENALPELRDMLGEKKFMNRLKKAARLLMEGLHKDEISKKKKEPVKKAATKKVATKKTTGAKATAKPTAAKKAATKTSKAAAKKAKTANKTKAGKQ
jgi:hypothetical protein